jgi:hypothetical protein
MSLIQRHRTWWPASRTFLDLLASVISGAFLHSGPVLAATGIAVSEAT